MASGAGESESPAKTGADAAVLPVKRNEPIPFAWEDAPSADDCMPVLGVAEFWPELPRSAAAAAKGKALASSTAPAALKPTAAFPKPQGATSAQNPGAGTSRRSERAGSAAAVEPFTMHAPNNRERHAAAAEQPNHRSNNNAGFRGHNHNGRFMPHPHGRGGEGYNRGSRRPFGGANGRGDADVHVNGNGNNAYRNRGSGWHGQEHRGGFNGHPRGRGHHGPGHRPLGPPMGYVEAPPHHMLLPPPPPFMDMAPMPPYPDYYGPPVGYWPYGYPEFVPGYFVPPLPVALPPFMPPEALPPFMHYPAPQMDTNLEQQAGPSQAEQQQQQHAPQQPAQGQQAPLNQKQQPNPEQQQQQHAPQQPAQGQQAPLNQEQQPNPEQLQQAIRQQIEYYFSTENLEGVEGDNLKIADTYLREHMDEQGWVPLTLIAGFQRICSQTNDMELILNSILPSNEVEVQDLRVRKRVGWKAYPLPPSN